MKQFHLIIYAIQWEKEARPFITDNLGPDHLPRLYTLIRTFIAIGIWYKGPISHDAHHITCKFKTALNNILQNKCSMYKKKKKKKKKKDCRLHSLS